MRITGPIESDRELLANLKQDESNTYQSGEVDATKKYIAGAEGKLAAALSQKQGDSDINTGGQRLARDVQASGGEVDRDAIQESLNARAKSKIEEEYGGQGLHMEKKSESARLQSAAEQYDLARQGKKDQLESTLDKQYT